MPFKGVQKTLAADGTGIAIPDQALVFFSTIFKLFPVSNCCTVYGTFVSKTQQQDFDDSLKASWIFLHSPR